DARSGTARTSPRPAAYMTFAIATTARRRAPSPYQRSITLAAHSGERSSWQVIHGFGAPKLAVISGTGGENVWSRRRVSSRQLTSLMWHSMQRLPGESAAWCVCALMAGPAVATDDPPGTLSF